MHLGVGLSGCGASHGACRNRSFRAQSELALKQFIRSPLTHYQHDQVRCRAADLEAKTPTLNADRRRRGPTRAALVPTRHVAFPIFTANEESASLEVRYNHYAMGLLQQFLRNALIRRSHDL